MKIEVELKHFTPLLDVLVQKYGLVTASVYGMVWRYSQMENKVCSASLEKIAGRLNIGRKTVERHIKKLCDDGYIDDLTPAVKNAPHIYVVTDKAKMVGTVEAKTSPEPDNQRSVRESHQQEEVSQRVSPRSVRESHPGQSESLLKKDIKKDNKDIPADAEKSILNDLAFRIATDLCHVDIDTASAKTRKALKRLTLALYQKGVANDDIASFGKWWEQNDWRGQRGQSPEPDNVGDSWGEFEAYRQNGSSKNGVVMDSDGGMYL